METPQALIDDDRGDDNGGEDKDDAMTRVLSPSSSSSSSSSYLAEGRVHSRVHHLTAFPSALYILVPPSD